MKNERLDEAFKNAFKVKINQQFKEDLKKRLLIEYEKRNRKKMIYRLSTLVATCFLLSVMIFLGPRLAAIISGNFWSNDHVSVQKQTIEANGKTTDNAVTGLGRGGSEEDDKDTQKTNKAPESPKVRYKASDKVLKENGDKNAAVSVKSNDVKKYQNSNAKDDKKSESSQKEKIIAYDFKVVNIKKDTEKSKKGISNSSKTNPSVRIPGESSQASQNLKKTDKKESIPSTKMGAEESVVLSKEEKKSNLIQEKSQKDEKPVNAAAKDQSANEKSTLVEPEKAQKILPVYISAYAIKEEKIDIDEKRLNEILTNVFSSFQSNFGTVNVTIYSQDVSSCVYIAQNNIESFTNQSIADISNSAAIADKDEIEKKTDIFLKSLNIADYKLDIKEDDEGYLVNIYYFDNIEIFDEKSYLRFDHYGLLKEGIINLKRFSVTNKIDIVDAKTAINLFKQKHNLIVDKSRIKLYYKRFGDIYRPVYIYKTDNKIYFVE